MIHIKGYTVAYTSLFLGIASILMFAAFLFLGNLNIINMKMPPEQAIAFDAVLSIVFFVQHSVMIRRSVRDRISRIIPGEYYNAFYSIVSSVTLIALLLLWQRIPPIVIKAEAPLYWSLRIVFFLCIAGFYWGSVSLKSMDPYGFRRLKRHILHKNERSMPLTVQGAYRWMRHPLYFFMLLMIWSYPEPTADRLFFNALWTVWIIAGTFLEERDLARDFGEDYIRYRVKVPMIIPYKLPEKSI